MPFRAMPQDGALTPEDLDFLQQVYETAAAGISNIDDATMHDVVKVLITYYQAGERDPDKLAGIAARDIHRAAG
ncbi:MAG: hypothetical protein ACTHJY_07225 [Rhizobiaceae bacterium]